MIVEKLFRKFFGKSLRQTTRYEEDSGKKKATLEEMNKIINLPDGYLGKIERGERLPSALILYKLFVTCGISIDKLFNKMRAQIEMQEATEKKGHTPK